MRSESPRLRAALALVAAAALLGAGACGEEERPFRIGVVVDCVGIYRSLKEAELSGARLPLIERGGEVAGRPVELVPGCTEAVEFSIFARELRRLAELERVDAIVAAGTGPDELVLRDVARAHPGVVFLPVVHGPREVTLRRAASNLYRFAADHGQGVAGLATYAYRELGWRRAAVVLHNWDVGWVERAAFVTEFCALGGTVSEQLSLDFFSQADRLLPRVPRDVDGVAVLAPGFADPVRFLNRLARRRKDPAREIVVGAGVVDDPAVLGATARALAGATGSSFERPALKRAYLRRYARAFPGASAALAGSEKVSGYSEAVEALLAALERAGGDSERLPRELARLRIDLLGGPVRLDEQRQAVASTTLVRIEPGAGPGGQPRLIPVRTIRDVDQSLGGLLSPELVPSNRPVPCERNRNR